MPSTITFWAAQYRDARADTTPPDVNITQVLVTINISKQGHAHPCERFRAWIPDKGVMLSQSASVWRWNSLWPKSNLRLGKSKEQHRNAYSWVIFHHHWVFFNNFNKNSCKSPKSSASRVTEEILIGKQTTLRASPIPPLCCEPAPHPVNETQLSELISLGSWSLLDRLGRRAHRVICLRSCKTNPEQIKPVTQSQTRGWSG